MISTKRYDTKKLVLTSVLTAIVIVLQSLAIVVSGPVFSLTWVLIPIVIGAATCGRYTAIWLGFLFGAVVLISGQANQFLFINAPGTIITVLTKGILCGFVSAIVYQWLEKYNRYLAVMVSAVVCPLVNTGVFLLGCIVFFMNTLREWAAGTNVIVYMFVGLVGINFIIEILCNIVLSPVVVRLLNIRKPNKIQP